MKCESRIIEPPQTITTLPGTRYALLLFACRQTKCSVNADHSKHSRNKKSLETKETYAQGLYLPSTRVCLLPSSMIYLRYSLCCLCSLLHLIMHYLRYCLASLAASKLHRIIVGVGLSCIKQPQSQQKRHTRYQVYNIIKIFSTRYVHCAADVPVSNKKNTWLLLNITDTTTAVQHPRTSQFCYF